MLGWVVVWSLVALLAVPRLRWFRFPASLVRHRSFRVAVVSFVFSLGVGCGGGFVLHRSWCVLGVGCGPFRFALV